MTQVVRFLSALFFLALLLSHGMDAQQTPAGGPCAMPSFSKVVSEANMFNEQQEEWLGEIQTQMFQKEFHTIVDPENDYLQKLGERLLAQLPPTRVHYHFVITDFPGADSFGMAGGYIYVSRKIIALAQNEDELAGLLGHEIGHIITRQQAIDITQMFQAVLNVHEVGDRKDIYDKFNRLLDTAAKSSYKHSGKREHEEQLIADRIALYAMARAGYDPARFAGYFDRIAETRGNKGGFWSYMFGTTSSGSKRLRELVRNSAPLPAECVSPLPTESAAHFSKWQKSVIESKFATAAIDVPGMLGSTDLKPHLRDDLRTLQFSPDGKYLLGQDEDSIFVLSREPLASLFRIDAPDSNLAHFTPDSRSIVFYDKELRVESWEIATRQRSSVYELTAPRHCLQTELSPSGKVLACLTSDLELQLIEVAGDKPLFSKKKFFEPDFADAWQYRLALLLNEPFAPLQIQFSPDDRYFVAGHRQLGFCFDLAGRAEIKLPSKMKTMFQNTFAFISADEIAGYTFEKLTQIVRVRFPSGEEIERIPGPLASTIAPAVKGKYIMLYGVSIYPAAALDLEKKKVTAASRAAAFAIYDPYYAGEAVGGEIGIFNISDNQAVARVQLPDSPLASPRARAFSADGKWLAVSGQTRGSVWNLETGERVFHTLAFEGAWFDHGQFIAKFPGKEKAPARVFQFDPVSKATASLYDISRESDDKTKVEFTSTLQTGDLLIQLRTSEDKRGNSKRVMEVHDIRTDKKLWERPLPDESPNFFYSGTGQPLTLLIIDYKNIKLEAAQDPVVSARLNAIEGDKGKKDSYLLRILDPATGGNLGSILIDSGNLSFKVRWAFVTGDTVLVGDTNDRTLLYSLKSGEQRGKVFGRPAAISKSGDVMLIENGPGNVDAYDTSTLQSLAHYSFPSRLTTATFSEDGKSIFMLTSGQTAYKVKNPAAEWKAAQ